MPSTLAGSATERLDATMTRVVQSTGYDCKSCGACCSYSADWPRFSIEDDAELDLIPTTHVSVDRSGMRCDGARCSALAGEVGKSTTCRIYDVRPVVCRACMPGDRECLMARQAFGLSAMAAASADAT